MPVGLVAKPYTISTFEKVAIGNEVKIGIR